MLKHLPNILTLGNAFCGGLAVVFAFEMNFELAFLMVLAGIIFDFLDGFVARLVNATGELGKQLDSLADAITSGIAPAVITYNFLVLSYGIHPLNYCSFALMLFAVLRLAIFNISTNQTDGFVGLPVPAMSLFFASLPLVSGPELGINYLSKYETVIMLVAIFSWLMVSKIPILALKFKSFGWKGNEMRYLLVLLALLALIVAFLMKSVMVSVPIVLILHIFLSIINNLKNRYAV